MPLNQLQQRNALRTLELSPTALEGLSIEDKLTKLRKKMGSLSLACHPDKDLGNPDATRLFQAVREAYELLRNDVNANGPPIPGYISEFDNYFKPQPVVIPNTAFNLLMHEEIEAADVRLRRQFSELSTPAEKRAFISTYTPFFNLATSLQEKAPALFKVRTNALRAQEDETLKELLIREWRLLIVQLFAEEYLDDFLYRQALATGDLWPILATRKLLSPVKWIAAILNSPYLVLSSSVLYFRFKFIYSMFTECMVQYAAYQNGRVNLARVGVIALKIMGLIGLPFIIGSVLPFQIINLALCMPLLTKLLMLVATPVNGLVRPLSRLTGVTPIGLTVLLGLLAVTAVYVFSLLDVLNLFMGRLSISASLYMAIRVIFNKKSAMAEKIEVLPLPTEVIPDSIREATQLGVKRALLSHKYFNTPCDAEFIKPEDRTAWQQASSFFGGGELRKKEPVPIFAENARQQSYISV